MKIFFVSKNRHKYEELKNIISKRKKVIYESLGSDLELIFHELKIRELQTDSFEKLVREKVLMAFKELQRPVLVEHTALYINAFNRLPGLQTKHFYEKLDAQGIIDYCIYKNDFKAEAITWLGFCDGKNIEIVEGRLKGRIVEKLKSAKDVFDWDCIFIPNIKNNNNEKTFAEFENKKDEISMRKIAWETLENKLLQMCSNLERNADYQRTVDELAKLIKKRKVMLFLGAGISASMELPDWGKLLGELGKELGYDEDIFKTYGDYMVLAEYAKKRKNNDWGEFFETKFDLSKVPNYEENLKINEIYQIISDFDFPVVYTTNYDQILENYLALNNIPFQPIVKMQDMDNISSDVMRIIKFHGDAKDSKGKVLSESEYFERMDFEDFRDILLQADLLQYHVFFLGYSLSDINVKLILYRANNRWKKQGGGKKAFIFSTTPNQIREEIFSKNNITTIHGEKAKKEGTLQFLRDLQQAKRELEKKETGGDI